MAGEHPPKSAEGKHEKAVPSPERSPGGSDKAVIVEPTTHEKRERSKTLDNLKKAGKIGAWTGGAIAGTGAVMTEGGVSATIMGSPYWGPFFAKVGLKLLLPIAGTLGYPFFITKILEYVQKVATGSAPKIGGSGGGGGGDHH